MATEKSLVDQYEEGIDGLLAIIDSIDGGEESSGRINSDNLSKEEVNRLDRWRLLEVEMKLLKDHYLTIVREKNKIIEEKSRFMDEKLRFVEEKHLFQEKFRMLQYKESEMRKDKESLKNQTSLEEAMGQIKKLTEERDQLKKEQVEDRERFEKEMSEVKSQLNKLVNEKDGEFENFIMETNKLFGERNRMILELELKNEALKKQLKEAMEDNKELTDERDQLKQKQVDDQKRFDRELNEIKEQLDEQGKLVKEKDGEIEEAIEKKNEMILDKDELKSKLKEAIEQNKKLTEKQNQLLREQVADSVRSTPSVSTATSSTNSESEQKSVVNENTSTGSATPNNDKKQEDKVVAIGDNKNKPFAWKIGDRVMVHYHAHWLEATIVAVDEVNSQIKVRYDGWLSEYKWFDTDKLRLCQKKPDQTMAVRKTESDEKKNRMWISDGDESKRLMEKEAEQNKKLTNKHDQLLREQVSDQKRLERKLNEAKEMLDGVKLASEKDDQVKKLKKQKQAGDKSQQTVSECPTRYNRSLLDKNWRCPVSANPRFTADGGQNQSLEQRSIAVLKEYP